MQRRHIEFLLNDPSKLSIALGVFQRSGLNINELESESTKARLHEGFLRGFPPAINSLLAFNRFGPYFVGPEGELYEDGLSFQADFGVTRDKVVFLDEINAVTLGYLGHLLQSERVTGQFRRLIGDNAMFHSGTGWI